GSPRPLQYLDKAPALGAAERPGLDHPDRVALVRLVALVVRVQRRRPADDLLVLAMATGHVDPNRDRLVRLRRDDHALARLGPARAVLLGRRSLPRRSLAAGGALLLAAARAPAAAVRR